MKAKTLVHTIWPQRKQRTTRTKPKQPISLLDLSITCKLELKVSFPSQSYSCSCYISEKLEHLLERCRFPLSNSLREIHTQNLNALSVRNLCVVCSLFERRIVSITIRRTWGTQMFGSGRPGESSRAEESVLEHCWLVSQEGMCWDGWQTWANGEKNKNRRIVKRATQNMFQEKLSCWSARVASYWD